MSVTVVEAQIARSKHQNYERTEQHCRIKAPNERTEQREWWRRRRHGGWHSSACACV